MKKKQTKNRSLQLEKILTIAGVLLVVVGCIANIYSIYNNLRFINNETMSWLYYSRYLLLLGGGFALGYLITKKPDNKLFGAVFYVSLAMALSLLIDTVRIVLYSLLGNLPESLGDWLFFGAPVLTILGVMLVGFISHVRKDRSVLNRFTKLTLIAAFLAYELYTLAASIYFFIAGDAAYDTSVPTSVLVGSLLTLPLVIALISYLLLGKIKSRLDRLFYASFIATLYAALTLVLWEFRTDASAEATYAFSTVVSIITILYGGIILWLTRKATK